MNEQVFSAPSLYGTVSTLQQNAPKKVLEQLQVRRWMSSDWPTNRNPPTAATQETANELSPTAVLQFCLSDEAFNKSWRTSHLLWLWRMHCTTANRTEPSDHQHDKQKHFTGGVIRSEIYLAWRKIRNTKSFLLWRRHFMLALHQ